MCPFHSGNSQKWKDANRRDVPDAEVRFMRVVERTACGVDWCPQVRPKFFGGDYDFWNWRRNAYVQIDESHHGTGMTPTGDTKQSRIDFACNLAEKPGSCWQSALLLLSMIICIDHASKNLLEHPPAACGCPGWRTTCAIFKSPVCFLCGQLLLKSKDTQLQMIGCSSSLVTCPGVELDVGLHVAAPQ